jgi:hypothetical protein
MAKYPNETPYKKQELHWLYQDDNINLAIGWGLYNHIEIFRGWKNPQVKCGYNFKFVFTHKDLGKLLSIVNSWEGDFLSSRNLLPLKDPKLIDALANADWENTPVLDRSLTDEARKRMEKVWKPAEVENV